MNPSSDAGAGRICVWVNVLHRRVIFDYSLSATM